MAQALTRRCITPDLTDIKTNLNTEQVFTTKLKIPAFELRAGYRLKVGAAVKHIATNSTDTGTVKLYLGTGGNASDKLIGDTGAVDMVNNDCASIRGEYFATKGGKASVAEIAGAATGVPKSGGTVKEVTFDGADAKLSFVDDMYLTVTVTHSVADPGNQSRLDALWYELEAFVAN